MVACAVVTESESDVSKSPDTAAWVSVSLPVTQASACRLLSRLSTMLNR